MLEQSDNKRTDVKRIHIKYTRDQPLGYKLEKLKAVSRAVATDHQAAAAGGGSPKKRNQVVSFKVGTAGNSRLSTTMAEDDSNFFMQKLDVKRNNAAPLLHALIDPLVKEISEKYAPLYELKM